MLRAFANRILNSLARRTGDYVLAHLSDANGGKSAPPPPTMQQDADGWGAFTIALEYPSSSNNCPRWGNFRATHGELERLLQQAEEKQRQTMDRIVQVSNLCAEVAETLEESDPRPRWRNPMMAGLDACSIGAFLSDHPVRYMEIGSGHSTKFARHFIDKLGSQTKLISVDPHPRSECDQLCDEIVRLPLESVDLDLFQRLHPGDILFVDGSHRCFMNSDVTVFFIDVLPRIRSGVIIGIHDIFIPDDYPAEWAKRYYSEQYVLSSYLLGALERIDVLWAAYYQCKSRQNQTALQKAAHASGCPLDLFHGCGFWFTHSK